MFIALSESILFDTLCLRVAWGWGAAFHLRGMPWVDGSSHGNELRGK